MCFAMIRQEKDDDIFSASDVAGYQKETILIPTKRCLESVKGAQSRLNGLKSLGKLFNFVVCNPCQSSPSLTILAPLSGP